MYASFFIQTMANFQQQLVKAKRIDADIVSNELFEFIRSLSAEIVQLNKDQINIDSEDIYGKAIGFYSKATEVISGGEKRAGQPFTGKDTGSWLNQFYMTVYDKTFYFGSTDPKTDDILDSPNWLSHDLFGLTEENLFNVIQDKFKPFIINHYRKALDL